MRELLKIGGRCDHPWGSNVCFGNRRIVLITRNADDSFNATGCGQRMVCLPFERAMRRNKIAPYDLLRATRAKKLATVRNK